MAFCSAGLTKLSVFAEQWLRKRRCHVIIGSSMIVVSTKMGKNEALECT